MKNILTWVIVAVVVVGGGWYFLSKGGVPTMTEGSVKVGVILPLTGEVADLGEGARNTIQIAADEINAAGGVAGNNLVLIFEDGACDGASAANAMQKLVNVDQVEVVIGAGCSGESLAAEPIATGAKVAMLSPISSSPKLTGKSPYFARNYPSDAFQGKVLADIAKAKGYKKVAVLNEQTDYAQALAKTFSDTFSSSGGTVVSDSFLTEATDFKTPLAKLKAAGVDAVFISSQSSASGQRILKQLQDMAWSPKLFVADTIIGSAETVTAYVGVLEGAIGAEFGTDPSNPKLSALIANYKARFGADIPYAAYAQAEYDAVFIVRDAIKAVGYDGTKIASYLHNNVKNWQGASGSVTIGIDGDPTVGHRPEVIMDGKVMPYVK